MGPFDRFNHRAKRILALAQDEALRFNHNYIGVEHLLLGLIREGQGTAARALDSLGVDLGKARSSVEFIIGRGDSTVTPSDITLSPRTKKVVELAIDESRKLGHSYVGTEHLLLGVVREGGSVGAGVLQSLGVTLDQVRERVIELLGKEGGDPAAGAEAGRPPSLGASVIAASHPISNADRLDASVRRALAHAYWEAGRANAGTVASHHLLLGLLTSGEIWTRQVLARLDLDASRLIALIDAAAPPREGTRPECLDEQAGLGEVLARAGELAAERNSVLIRSGHVLLAIASTSGIGANVLIAAGAPASRIREILEKMSG